MIKDGVTNIHKALQFQPGIHGNLHGNLYDLIKANQPLTHIQTLFEL